jgi:hypothetical protein
VRSERDSRPNEVQQALERIAIEESRQNYQMNIAQGSGLLSIIKVSLTSFSAFHEKSLDDELM